MLPASPQDLLTYVEDAKKASDFIIAFPGKAFEYATEDAEKFTQIFKLLRNAASCQLEAMEIAEGIKKVSNKVLQNMVATLLEKEKDLDLESLKNPGFDQLKQPQQLPREGTVFSYHNEEGQVNNVYLAYRFPSKSI